MPRLTTSIVLFLFVLLCASLAVANTQPPVQSLNHMPLAFTKNNGQWDSQVLFRTSSGGATIWVCKDRVVYQFVRNIGRGTRRVPATLDVLDSSRAHAMRPYDTDAPDSIEQLVITARFVDANSNPDVIADGQMEYKCNYFIGNEPSKWHTDVPNYEAITLKDIYPGIDLKHSGDDNGQAAYEFIAAPGADIAQIRVEYEGAEGTSADAEGNTILKTKWGEMVAAMGLMTNTSGLATPRLVLSSEQSPSLGGGGQSLSGERSGTLELGYSTYLGGSGYDCGRCLTVDDSGFAYVVGRTGSANFSTWSAYQELTNGTPDAFVVKMKPTGGRPVFATYVGGSGTEEGFGIAIDKNCCVYLTGCTSSSDFPLQDPFQPSNHGGFDAFVTKLGDQGNALIYSTYLGGSDDDLYWYVGSSIAVDDVGCAHVAGSTKSVDFPMLNPLQSTNHGEWDIFVVKLDSSGSNLEYGTYIGGSRSDDLADIAIDGSGCYLTGGTWSADYPTANAFQSVGIYYSAFVTKLNSNGTEVVYSTFLGGSETDWGSAIALDSGGNAYVTGGTYSIDFPTKDAIQGRLRGPYDAFVIKIGPNGDSVVYSTFLGGGSSDLGSGIAVDGSGNSFITGLTSSSDFPLLSPFQSLNYSSDGFVTKLNRFGTAIVYSTFLGGSAGASCSSIAIDHRDATFVTGETYSSDFPTSDPWQSVNLGGADAFVTKLVWTPDGICGDVNNDDKIDLSDAVFLINYMYVGGPAPELLSWADVDCSSTVNLADIVYLIRYIFRSGPAPCSECDL